MTEEQSFTPSVETSDPRMRRALDSWLGLYEACYIMSTQMRAGAARKAATHLGSKGMATKVNEDPPRYGIPSAQSPRPEHILKALLAGARTLNELDVPYVLGGGVAMGFHDRERATRDVDFFLLCPRDQLGPIVEGLKRRDIFPHTREGPMYLPPGPLFWWSPFQYGLPDAPPVDVDLFAADHEFMAVLHATGIESELSGVRVRVVSVEGLLLLKLRVDRGIDRTDVVQLLRANPKLDRPLLEAWVKKFKLEARLAEMEKEAREYRRLG